MRMIVAMVDKERQSEVTDLLRGQGVSGYSIIPSVFGKGETGAHFGNRIFPGENSMILALASKAEVEQLSQAFRAFSAGLRSEEAFKVIVLDADVLI